MPRATIAIAVMAKAPRPGRAKTRLLPLLAAEEAAGLARAFLADVTANLALAARTAPILPCVAYAPAGSEALFEGILAPGTRLVLADGAIEAPPDVTGFGTCLLHAIRALFAAGHRAACVLNADSPNLPTGLLTQAAEWLGEPGDHGVLGPAEDGGYTFLGLTREHAELFAGIDWSTDRVARQTRERAAAIGVPLRELEPWYDVDDPASLGRLIRDLGAGTGYAAPATLAAVARFGLAARLADPASTAA
jgi:uncharacterized protein